MVEIGPTISRMRKSYSTVKYFTAPFTAAKYKNPHMGQQQEAWIEYQAALDKDKKMFFDGHLNVSDTLHRYMDLASNKMTDDEGAAAKKAATIAQQKINTMNLFVQSDADSMWYSFTITHAMHFELAMDFVAIGMSFRQVSKAIEHAKIRTCTTQLTGINDLIVSHHTLENIFHMLEKFLDALYEPWRAKLISMSADGVNTIKGHHRGLVTRMVETAENPVVHIWRLPHQMDPVVKLAAECLIAFGVENCPKATPTSEWCLITFSYAPVIESINLTLAILQSRWLIIAQQESHINALVGTLTAMFDVEIVDQVDSYDDGIDVVYELFGSMRIPVDSIVAHIYNQDSFATTFYDELDPAEKAFIVGKIAKYNTTVITGLISITAERDGDAS
uniref:Uncharacterized protein n=1 Tax=Hyaloperonospora arabidopsidis (strain Emoy2) TaxID=559515 RepID=M4BY05_HYAAE